MSDLLGTDFGAPENEQAPAGRVTGEKGLDGARLDDFAANQDGGGADATHLDDAELREILAELLGELEHVRRENEELLVDLDTASEVMSNLREQVEDLENEARVSDHRVHLAEAGTQPAGNAPIFDSLGDWVQAWLLPLYRRELDGRSTTFCVHWWRHPEAYYRLDALWKSWEFNRLRPGTGTAVWLKDYLDPHMAVLMSSNGPMHGCTLKKHSDNATEPWALSRLPTVDELAWAYRMAGEEAFTAERLSRIEAVPWDGKDQR